MPTFIEATESRRVYTSSLTEVRLTIVDKLNVNLTTSLRLLALRPPPDFPPRIPYLQLTTPKKIPPRFLASARNLQTCTGLKIVEVGRGVSWHLQHHKSLLFLFYFNLFTFNLFIFYNFNKILNRNISFLEFFFFSFSFFTHVKEEILELVFLLSYINAL